MQNFIPDNFADKKFIHFAADNVDYQEDTPHGKRTLYATVMSIYRHTNNYTDNSYSQIKSGKNISNKLIKEIPTTIFPLLECEIPRSPKTF